MRVFVDQHELAQELRKFITDPYRAIDNPVWLLVNTTAPGVVLPERIKRSHPTSILIVLQYRFWELGVYDDRLEFGTSFNQIKTDVVIPWDSLIGSQQGKVREEQTLKPDPGTTPKVVSLADYRKK